MKIRSVLSGLVLILGVLVLSSCGSAQPKAEASLSQLVSSSMKGDFAQAGSLIAYRGPDSARNWMDVCDFTKEGDANRVSMMVGQLLGLFAGTDGKYQVTGYKNESESKGTYHILKVQIPGSEKGEDVEFAFMEIKGVFALADID